MKKIISTLALILIPLIGFCAEDKTESKVYVPEKGDLAIGISLNPILKYAGNFFGGSNDNTLNTIGGEPVSNAFNDADYNNIAPSVSIMGKYMLNNKWGLRTNIGLMLRNDIANSYVQKDKDAMLDPFSESKLIDTQTKSRNGLSMMFGAEYHKGQKRVQGIFGVGALFGFISDKTTYKYANTLTTINQQPSVGFNDVYTDLGYRILSQKSTNSIFFGVTGSTGVECFVAPKVAIGAEVNLSLYYIAGGQQYVESEGYNPSTEKIETRTDLVSPGNDKFRFGTENIGCSLYMSFYF